MLVRRCKRNGKDIHAHDVLDDDERAKIVRLNEGYYIFKDIRNYPAYLAMKKTEAFAMNDMSTEDARIIYITIC